MIVHRSSTPPGNLYDVDLNGDRPGRSPSDDDVSNNNIHSLTRHGYKASASFATLSSSGKSRTVKLVGFFAIGSVCLLFSLGFFVGHDAGTGGGAADAAAQDQSLQSPVVGAPDVEPSGGASAAATSTTTASDQTVSVNKNKKKKQSSLPSIKKLKVMIADLAGADKRIMRWSAKKHTVKRQRQGGCSKLRQALAVILDSKAQPFSDEHKRYAAEFATFCITDNHVQREIFAQYHHGKHHADDGRSIHEAVVDLVGSTASPMASAMAGHLIYIASFSNAKNQQTFFKAGAVEALANVVMNKKALPVQVMWAAAALQNLAASYCKTEHDGRCYWDWNDHDSHVVINDDSLPVISDGQPIRKGILKVDGLVDALTAWACTGPVHGQESAANPFPGSNTEVDRDENSPNIVAWAAAGAIKNIALEPSSLTALELSIKCLCRMQSSPDWLEQLKAQQALHFMRRGEDPCWFESNGSLCIDDNFFDAEQYSCDGYGEPEEGDCDIADALFPEVVAHKACCACGGGRRVKLEVDQA